MRRIVALVAGVSLLAGCSPRQLVANVLPLVHPDCHPKREFCPDPGAVSTVDSEPPGYPPLTAPTP